MSVVQLPERRSCIRHGSARHPDERLVTVAEQLAAQVNEGLFNGAPPENVRGLSVLCHVLLDIAGETRITRIEAQTLRAAIRVNALVAGKSHEEVDALLRRIGVEARR